MEKVVKILILEDNIDDAALIQIFLKRANLNFDTTVVEDREQFAEALKKGAFDAVLSDHSLAQFNSTQALKMVKDAKPFMPFIVLTGAVTEESAIAIFEKGADNYIMKDNLRRLPSAILKAIETQEALSKRVRR